MLFKKLRIKFYYWRLNNFRTRLLKKVLKYLNKSEIDDDMKGVYQYLKEYGLVIFPYIWTHKYQNMHVEVYFENGFPYVIHKGNRFYFKKGWSKSTVVSYYRDLLKEQDPDSPHLYCEGGFDIESDDILLDLGVAEGSFSIDNIEKAKSIYIFERDLNWFKSLEKTFEPFSNKVKLFNKYVGSIDSDSEVSLDSLHDLRGQNLFIKIDVDGSERGVLEGMKNLLLDCATVKIAICTYHYQNDYFHFESFFENLGYKVSSSRGYMLFYHDKAISEPYFRKGVLRAQKY